MCPRAVRVKKCSDCNPLLDQQGEEGHCLTPKNRLQGAGEGMGFDGGDIVLILAFNLLFFILQRFVFMCKSVVPECMSACVSGAHRGQNRALDLLEAELRTTVSRHVV